MYKSNPNAFVNYTVPEEYERIVAYKNVTAMWHNSAQAYANDVAIVDNGREFTFAALDADVAAFRAVLVEKGIKQGDNVGVYMPNCAEFVKAFLAITTLGAVAVLLPPHLDNITVFGIGNRIQGFYGVGNHIRADIRFERFSDPDYRARANDIRYRRKRFISEALAFNVYAGYKFFGRR